MVAAVPVTVTTPAVLTWFCVVVVVGNELALVMLMAVPPTAVTVANVMLAAVAEIVCETVDVPAGGVAVAPTVIAPLANVPVMLAETLLPP